MKSNNVLQLDLAGNEEVKAALGGLGVGEDYCITICGKVTSVDDQTFEGSIDEITPEDGGESSDVSHDEPVMMLVMKGKKKKSPEGETDGRKATSEEETAEGE